eukprot:14686124-Heterocapsa_arctica.AAC.1
MTWLPCHLAQKCAHRLKGWRAIGGRHVGRRGWQGMCVVCWVGCWWLAGAWGAQPRQGTGEGAREGDKRNDGC